MCEVGPKKGGVFRTAADFSELGVKQAEMPPQHTNQI